MRSFSAYSRWQRKRPDSKLADLPSELLGNLLTPGSSRSDNRGTYLRR